MTYSYRDIIKLKFPHKKAQRYINNTYEGIIWNSLDNTPHPTKAELDLAILNEGIGSNVIDHTTIKVIKVPAISGTSIIPLDNSEPLITEGMEFLSNTLSCRNSLSKMMVFGNLALDCASPNKKISIALFRNSQCVGVNTNTLIKTGDPQIFSFSFSDDYLGNYYGASVTYSLRVGAESSALWYLNRFSKLSFNNLLSANSVVFLEHS